MIEAIMNYLSFEKKACYLTGISLAQNFEDLVFEKLWNEGHPKAKGFYVDVGAHDPIRFSNTYRLYRQGWRGINIDPLPSCIKKFRKHRPEDINLNIGISDNTGEMDYYSFVEPAFNTTNPVRAEHVINSGYSKLKEKTVIRIDTLKNVLDSHLGAGQIDLLTMDVETMELQVLKSNDWDKYRPEFIIMESIVSCNESLDKIYNDPAVKYLTDRQYIAVAKVSNAVFFQSIRSNANLEQ